jgi:hypothetical protein
MKYFRKKINELVAEIHDSAMYVFIFMETAIAIIYEDIFRTESLYEVAED